MYWKLYKFIYIYIHCICIYIRNFMQMSKTTISLRIDTELLERVRKIAKANWITVSFIVNLLLREFVETRELHLVDERKINSNYWDNDDICVWKNKRWNK